MTTALSRVTRIAGGRIGVLLTALMLVLTAFGPLLAPRDPLGAQPDQALLPPSMKNLMGTDELGRDLLSRVVYGARTSLGIGVSAVILATLVGGTVGLMAAYLGGWPDNLLMRVMEVLFTFPPILLALVVVAVLGTGTRNASMAIALAYTPIFARTLRGASLSVLGQDYVEAAHAVGAGAPRILARHILPNVISPLIVQVTLALAWAILTEASLSFLGLGTRPPTPSWGVMLSEGRRFMELAPWLAIFPGVAVMLAVLSFNMLGDALRDALDPRFVTAKIPAPAI